MKDTFPLQEFESLSDTKFVAWPMSQTIVLGSGVSDTPGKTEKGGLSDYSYDNGRDDAVWTMSSCGDNSVGFPTGCPTF